MTEEIWNDLLKGLEEEALYWKEIEENGSRYEGADDKLKEIRSKNASDLFKIVKKHGWPSLSKYGEKINESAFKTARFSIQHPEKMKYFKNELSKSVSQGESKSYHLAALTDCIQYYSGKPQELGLFFEWSEDGNLYANVENEASADLKRKELGIPPLKKAISQHLEELKMNPGGKPKNIKTHKEMHRAWAKSVGW